jgi:cell shape-determining protein MreD
LSYQSKTVLKSKSPPSIALFDPEWWKIAIALYAALLLQTTLLHGLPVSLALLLVLWYAMNAGAMRGALFGLIVGACEDSLGAGGGAWTFADAAAGAFAGALARTLPGSPLPAACAVIPLTVARYFVFLSVLHNERGAFAQAHWGSMLCQAFLNAVVALAAFIIAARFDLPYAGR